MSLFRPSLSALRREQRLLRERYEKTVQRWLTLGWIVIQCPACDNAFAAKDVKPMPSRWDCPCGVQGMLVRKR